jgi:hypothetical protein
LGWFDTGTDGSEGGQGQGPVASGEGEIAARTTQKIWIGVAPGAGGEAALKVANQLGVERSAINTDVDSNQLRNGLADTTGLAFLETHAIDATGIDSHGHRGDPGLHLNDGAFELKGNITINANILFIGGCRQAGYLSELSPRIGQAFVGYDAPVPDLVEFRIADQFASYLSQGYSVTYAKASIINQGGLVGKFVQQHLCIYGDPRATISGNLKGPLSP